MSILIEILYIFFFLNGFLFRRKRNNACSSLIMNTLKFYKLDSSDERMIGTNQEIGAWLQVSQIQDKGR